MLSPFKLALRRMPGVTPGTRSLHRHLLLWLLLPQLVLWLAAAYVTYNVADRYANRAIDAALKTATRSLARQVKPIGNGLFIDFPKAAQDIIEADPDDRVYYMVSTPPGEFILGNNKLPPPPVTDARLGETYFYNGSMKERTPQEKTKQLGIRVAAMYLSFGDENAPQRMLVQVARSRASGEELARQILVDTALPLSGLVALMSVIVWGGIRTGLAPLARLRAEVEDRAPNDLAPIKLEAAPEEVRALVKALNSLLAQVHENVSVQKRFISDAAHQLRTPLAGLKSQTELALTETDNPALQARLRRVHESATRSAHLINQLLTLARAEPESVAAQGRTRVDLRRLASEVTAELVPRGRHAGVDLGLDDGDEKPIEIHGNALLLRESLLNLVDNAIRYAGDGSVVTVRLSAQDSQAVLEVEDNGPGIAEADRERVFERFARATHEGNGCGLGLAIVKEIVERHTGTVELQAVQPHGLRAVVRLPRIVERKATMA
ncbi:sensor histidine kinase [Rhizobacter sp. SG703]|uniref:sensor histidine kinase n=1 Tax=Rhizobacter sp. SG703 TaxID=2587140 RepID=UPI0014465AB2|nr:sensor histidine kinase [Rhizobacter sp. SG703]NKI92632.1 two-component system sensor histidine kinase TctE [Rhizobacter sp. SG703]